MSYIGKNYVTSKVEITTFLLRHPCITYLLFSLKKKMLQPEIERSLILFLRIVSCSFFEQYCMYPYMIQLTLHIVLYYSVQTYLQNSFLLVLVNLNYSFSNNFLKLMMNWCFIRLFIIVVFGITLVFFYSHIISRETLLYASLI